MNNSLRNSLPQILPFIGANTKLAEIAVRIEPALGCTGSHHRTITVVVWLPKVSRLHHAKQTVHTAGGKQSCKPKS